MSSFRVSIVDLAFPLCQQASRGLAAQWLAWELYRRSIPESPLATADVLLVTMVDPIQVAALRRLRKRYPNRVLICGGAAGTSPAALGQYADMVCVGDGQPVIDALISNGVDAVRSLPNVWVNGDDRRVAIAQGFPWGCPPIKGEDGAVHVWCGRGCKKRCLFCQTGWSIAYAENPQPDKLLQQVRRLRQQGERVNYLSNDLSQHTFSSKLPATDHGSYSVDYLRQTGLPPARQVRLGVEGVSERMRRAVGKPIRTGDLLQCTSWLNANGHGVRWFMIAGLPGETDEDWQELREVVQSWKRHTAKGVLALSFTAFVPEPATPLGVLPLTDDYWPRWLAFREWFFGGQGWSNRVKLMSPSAPPGRLERAMASIAAGENEVRGGWVAHPSPNWRVQYLVAPQRLRQIAGVYACRVGMGPLEVSTQ